jgi:flagella basal body P-ring formation protein FlgA
MIDPIELVKTGQYVTINVANGGVNVKTVAKALEPGSFGQTIKVKNETTKDTFDVTITGPQTATLNAPPATENLADVK